MTRSTAYPCAIALALLVTSTEVLPQGGEDSTTTVRTLKVFLADYEDVPQPEGYTREYFERLFFSLGEPRETPESRGIAGSVREYFLDVSQGRLDVRGEVADWVRLPGMITRIPHWKGGMEPFGESWPVIVANTLRANGIVGEDTLEKVRLADGTMPELLVFLNTDWGTGGVNRGWGHLRDVLGRMGLSDLWDEAWLQLPEPLSSYSATKWRGAPPSGPDGTIDAIPPADEVEMFPLSVMMHEMGHQLAGWPDLYGPGFEPWGVFDLMGGPAVETHFPMGVSSYLRVNSGWMRFTDMERRSQIGLSIRPLESHLQALRFPQGPSQEEIVIENRAHLVYPHDFGEPPRDEGRRLLLYRLDPAGRRRVMYGDTPHSKITTVIRRPEHYGEMWGASEHAELTDLTTPSSRNSLGELWWGFTGIRPAGDGQVAFDAAYHARDLISEFHHATWARRDGSALQQGRFGRGEGHVGLRAAEADDDAATLVLEVLVRRGDTITGRLALPEGAPYRLYARTRSAPFSAAAARLELTAHGAERSLQTSVAGTSGWVAYDVPAGAAHVDITLGSEADAGDVTLWVEELWLVARAPSLWDLSESDPAGWTSDGGVEGVPGVVGEQRLRDGIVYGPAVTLLPLGGDGPGSWTGRWPLTLPAEPAVLRALVGLPDGADAGASALMEISWQMGEDIVPLVSNLGLSAPDTRDAADGRNQTAVIEVALPPSALETEGELVVRVSSESDTELAVAIPTLALCGG